MSTSTTLPDAEWIDRAEREGATREAALAAFDRCAPVPVEAMFGEWRGGEVATGHPMDGMLSAFGWYGKRFEDADRVFPLLFQEKGRTFALDPRWLPVGLAARTRMHDRGWAVAGFRLGKRLIATDQPGARLRAVEYRGVATATMIYDRQPINDHFREAAPGLLLGLMDLRGFPPFFFTLRRVGT
ncbi:DUF4334 domain-containing protein [Sphingomonas sp. CJ20]